MTKIYHKLNNVVNLNLVDIEEAKAQNMVPRHTIVKVRDKNRAKFVQLIRENVLCLIVNKYLTMTEFGFLLALSALVEMNTNAIVDQKNGQFLTVTEIAKKIGCSTRWAREIINNLIKKGIIYEVVDTEDLKKHGRVIKERLLFINPEIVFVGDKNRINAALCKLAIQNDIIEKQGIKLPWKLWLKERAEHGRLYRRETLIKYWKLKKIWKYE